MVEGQGEITKEGLSHVTFISAETAQYLRAYLRQREMKRGDNVGELYLRHFRQEAHSRAQTFLTVAAALRVRGEAGGAGEGTLFHEEFPFVLSR